MPNKWHTVGTISLSITVLLILVSLFMPGPFIITAALKEDPLKRMVGRQGLCPPCLVGSLNTGISRGSK